MFSFTVEEVTKIIGTSPRANGRYNLFFKLNDKVGLKLSTSKEIRDGNYERQKRASEFNLGPDTYGLMDIEHDGRQFYGYLTEIVETIDDGPEENYEDWRFWKDNVRSLVNDMQEEMGWRMKDSHSGNFGIKNGQLVCIDFDDFETEESYNRLEIREVNCPGIGAT